MLDPDYDWAELVDRLALGHLKSEPYEDITGKGMLVTLLMSEDDHKALMGNMKAEK